MLLPLVLFTALASPRSSEQHIVREVERGVYVRAHAGSTIFLGPRGRRFNVDANGDGVPDVDSGGRPVRAGPVLRPGTTLMLTVGGDVVDTSRLSLSVEGRIVQSLHKGMRFSEQADVNLDPRHRVQGHLHLFGAAAGIRGAVYPKRRLGLGLELGGGAALAPVLIERRAYNEDVVGTAPGNGAWDGGPAPRVHSGVLPMVYAGPTLEYYSKLSHMSLGVDVDFVAVFGLDYGLSITGHLKYTF